MRLMSRSLCVLRTLIPTLVTTMGDRPILPPLKQLHSPNHYEGRNGAIIKKVVVHVTVGSYAGAVQWMMSPRSEVAAHVCLNEDGTEATQLVAYGNSAW